MKEPCRSCAEREKDLGGCRCQAYLLTGDPSNTDPACALSPDHHVVLSAIENARRTARADTAKPFVFRNRRNSSQESKGSPSA